MAEVTKIAWTHSTFNPWIGCTKIAPPCDNCYAAARDSRHLINGTTHWGPGVARHRTSPSYWRQPLSWNKKAAASGEPWRVFSASQADVFDNEVQQEWRNDLFELISATPHLTWLLLTKRIGNVKEMLPADWGDGYPNVWLGITVGSQNEVERDVPKLQNTKARIRWLSIEPQLGSISLRPIWREQTSPREDGGFTYADYPLQGLQSNGCGFANVPKIDWVVNGGESRQSGKCRRYDIAWGRLLRAQCKQDGAAFFMKQLGHLAHDGGAEIAYTGKGDDPAEWPEEIRVREFPE